jgi:hypothetical protein
MRCDENSQQCNSSDSVEFSTTYGVFLRSSKTRIIYLHLCFPARSPRCEFTSSSAPPSFETKGFVYTAGNGGLFQY